ncbi:hypothetical protein C5167_024806 [Papaver somniferum]|uniref:Non-specific lipid-transfer protein n=1 Tax=Papaver somniferum TaxID=3469 RepID=A0A4Y7JTL9_PAPSO|nr:non-specific lipid-transfer protein 1-like [Papaver somniferum]RZC63035.1 hypothetical protein C5167_024806 [Papaver somniferum]
MVSTSRITSAAIYLFYFIVLMLSFASLKSEGQQLLCTPVLDSITPCIDYAFTGGQTVPQQCCDNIKKISTTKDDRQQVCQCAKNLAPMVPGLNYENVGNILKKCGVDVSLKISPEIDCAKLN